jgi:hypothetical protein
MFFGTTEESAIELPETHETYLVSAGRLSSKDDRRIDESAHDSNE